MNGQPRTDKRPLGERLVEAGLLTQAELLEALAQRQVVGGRRERLGETIRRLGFATEADIARTVAQQLGVRYADDDLPKAQPGAAALAPESLSRRHHVVPLWLEPDGTLVLACSDPTDVVAMDDVRVAAGARGLRPIVVTSDRLEAARSRVYRDEAHETLLDRLSEQSGDEVDEELVLDAASDAPVIRLAQQLIGDAIDARASDIHVEPGRAGTTVRYRVDGVLQEAMQVPRGVHAALVSRLKILAGMDIAERRRPQDGRASYRGRAGQVDLRVSTLPALHGEKVVLRLLRKGAEQLRLDDVGFSEAQHAVVLGHIERPQGLILLTGPTGAGKTSTLYAFLAHLASPESNLITVEDPVEYELDAVNQTQVNARVGYTFTAALRTVLRQDPDVVMVGEIRDRETAELALQASLTGHMVFSTLHTNDAPGAVVRLEDLDVPGYLVASSLTLVVAQRLARRVCPACITPSYPKEAHVERLRLPPNVIAEGDWRAGTGCSRCHHTGYEGRVGLFEVLPVDRGVRMVLAGDGDEPAIRSAARHAGMRTLREDGIRKAMLGLTTLDEVLRVTPSDDGEDPADEVDAPRPAAAVTPTAADAVTPPAAEPRGTASAPAPPALDQRPRVLIADAHRGPRADLGTALGAAFDVGVVDDARAAMAAVEQAHPDALVVAGDLDGDAHALVSELRGRPVTSHLPIVLLAPPDDPDAELRALRAGADACLRQPVDPSAVAATLSGLLAPVP